MAQDEQAGVRMIFPFSTQVSLSVEDYRGGTEFRPLGDIYEVVYKGRCICGYWDFYCFAYRQLTDRHGIYRD